MTKPVGMMSMAEYKILHQGCPKCGRAPNRLTSVSYPAPPDLNVVECMCNWIGTVNELKPQKKKETTMPAKEITWETVLADAVERAITSAYARTSPGGSTPYAAWMSKQSESVTPVAIWNAAVEASLKIVVESAMSGGTDSDRAVRLSELQEKIGKLIASSDGAPKEEKRGATIPQKITVDMVIEKYVATRDLIAEKTKALNAELADLKALQEKREAWLMSEMNRVGASSMKTPHGTSYIKTMDSVSVADWETFFGWVQANAEFEFLTHAVSKTAVKQRLEDGQAPPPGGNFTTFKGIKVRRS